MLQTKKSVHLVTYLLTCLAALCVIIFIVLWAFNPFAKITESANPDDVCRAAIASLFGRNVASVTVVNRESSVLKLRYTRPSDGTIWTNRCKVVGARIMWTSEYGRWRDHPLDEVVTYTVQGSKITINKKYSDGSSADETLDIIK